MLTEDAVERQWESYFSDELKDNKHLISQKFYSISKARWLRILHVGEYKACEG